MLAMNSIGHQQLTVSTAALGLTVPTGLVPRHALIQVGTNTVRWRADGTSPTASIGVILTAGGTLELTDAGEDYAAVISKIKFIATAADAVVDIEFFA